MNGGLYISKFIFLEENRNKVAAIEKRSLQRKSTRVGRLDRSRTDDFKIHFVFDPYVPLPRWHPNREPKVQELCFDIQFLLFRLQGKSRWVPFYSTFSRSLRDSLWLFSIFSFLSSFLSVSFASTSEYLISYRHSGSDAQDVRLRPERISESGGMVSGEECSSFERKHEVRGVVKRIYRRFERRR